MNRRTRLLIQANRDFQDLGVRTILNDTRKGKLNNGADLSLNSGATSTTISDELITTLSVIHFTAGTQEAAQKPLWYSSTEQGRVIINHASTSTSDVAYFYTVVG